MDYMTLKEASKIWGVTPRWINYYCSAGRIPGAEKMGTVWLIHSNEFNKKVEAGILTFILNIHNGTGVTVYKFRNIGLCPALFFSGSFESRPEAVKVKLSFILVHSHITLYHSTFRVKL